MPGSRLAGISAGFREHLPLLGPEMLQPMSGKAGTISEDPETVYPELLCSLLPQDGHLLGWAEWSQA
jgi:hypothetical protein